MSVDHRQVLLGIKRFDQLIAYLRDELGWPISRDSFDDVDDLFYDFSAEELGIDPKTAAKIQEIKRLRPLSTKQPWGIFFIKFEPKKLPVVALRRILGQVALKKRASANSAERTAWSADDLLFISNYGEGEDRQISFAHFSQSGSSDLPTLRVLGWNNLDTPLHLDAVAVELTQNLRWPEDDDDLEFWRKSWGNAFKLGHNEVINTAKDLSIRLAELASNIRDRIKTILSIETEFGPLTKLMKAFQSSLVHDLDIDGFADMYAQTIAYGLLSARITDPSKKTVDEFTSHMRTSPFLKELLETFLYAGGRKTEIGGSGIDFDELGLGDVIQLLDNSNMEAVIRDFGDRNRQEDPVMHFFEGFLQAYDSKIRKDRGVFYTPQSVVSCIVNSVHDLLKSQYGLVDGLADTSTWGEVIEKNPQLKLPVLLNPSNEKKSISLDEPFVQILDPATGTATFIVEVIEVVHRTLLEKWNKQGLSQKQKIAEWNEYVPKHLLPRLYAYELMMAPYAIAHMKIGLKLSETGYKFAADERARVYLTNALEPWQEQIRLPEFPALAHEALAVNEIKRYKCFTVVIGNPPYSGLSSNMTDHAQRIVSPYKFSDGKALNERKLWLQDDYVKFIRTAQEQIDISDIGIIGLITNHSYLDNPTFRGMRHSLLNTFSGIHIIDLHGNTNKKERSPDGSEDKNIFNIRQGVAICLAVRGGIQKIIDHLDVWGSQKGKYQLLSEKKFSELSFQAIFPDSPLYLLVPRSNENRQEYEGWLKITEIMSLTSAGFITARDKFVIDMDLNSLESRMSDFIDKTITTAQIRDKYFSGKGSDKYPDGDTRSWKLEEARKSVQNDPGRDSRIRKCLYRPFDERYIYWDPSMIDWPRPEVMGQMLSGDNLALITSRMTKGEIFAHAQVTKNISEVICMSAKSSNNGFVFPLWIQGDQQSLNLELDFTNQRPNFSSEFLKKLSNVLGVKQVDPFGLPADISANQIFCMLYSILYSFEYRSRYSEFLKTEFPRLPMTKSIELLKLLATLGEKLIKLHLFESGLLDKLITKFKGDKDTEIEKISWANNIIFIDKGQTVGFEGVMTEVWNFHVGGYQVCEKWLKDRKGRVLSDKDIQHFQKILVAISETIKVMHDIDLEIENKGGWPKAFEV
jgi:hypothetical protein